LPIVVVQGRLQRNERGDAASNFRDITDFVRGEAAAEERLFPVRKPLLNDLVAADVVVPCSRRHIRPCTPDFPHIVK
jgi:translation initiation factor 2 gamma subunit (eIF-2gamma)